MPRTKDKMAQAIKDIGRTMKLIELFFGGFSDQIELEASSPINPPTHLGDQLTNRGIDQEDPTTDLMF